MKNINREKVIARTIIRWAKEHAEKIKCSHCSGGDWKVAVINELPTAVPTDIILYCKKCQFNDSLSNLDPSFRRRIKIKLEKEISTVLEEEGASDIEEYKTKSGIILPKSVKGKKEENEDDKPVISDPNLY